MSEIESETLREITPTLADGRYTVLETIREGRLYLAERAGKRFVLKTAAGAKGLEMLKREYGLSIGLSHPSLAYVFTWEDDSPVGPCIVQEYIDGRSLRQWLGEKPSLKERRRVFAQLLDVVEYLHNKGVIHNDLTPENLLVSRADDSLKLIDLGFADNDSYLSHSLGGTRGYASPELLTGLEVDARSDIYSIGRLLQDIFPGRYRRIGRRCLNEQSGKRYASVPALKKALKRRLWPLWAVLGLCVFIGLAVYATRPDDLDIAKEKVESVYERAIPAFREALGEAHSSQEVIGAWNAFLEEQKVVNFDIPAAAPEAIRPTLRDYILQRNNEILPVLGDEMNARLRELSSPN